MDFQYSHPYSRPPPGPPSISDQHHYPPPPPPPQQQPVHPPGTLFSGQFQYHPSSSPPTHHHQWAPPPQPDHLPPPPPPYPLHQYPPPLPPRPHFPPPNPHSHIPQSYPQHNQDWGNPNWGHHQGWEYPAHNHEEDWAAKARAWASTKATTDTQSPQQHFMPVGRPEEQNLYPAQYLQNVDPHYSESNYTQHQHSHGYLSYNTRDGILAGDSNPSFPRQESSPTNLSVHQQEVPSSYSSVAGKEEAADQNERFYNSLPFSTVSTSQHQAQPPPPPPHYSFGNQSAGPATELNDQPLVFAHRFNHEHGSDVQPNYTHSWTPSAAPGVAYHPVPPLNSSGPQDQPAVAVNSPVSGYSAPIFGRMPGPSFQQSIPSVTPPFGTSTGNALHPTAAFPGDAYVASGVPERPKKAPVPNWLREEIIKKTVMASSALELSHVESKSVDEDDIDKSLRKGDQADSKSIDSSRSTEEEDDDEDNVEAARNAAINQEIKRVLTEVLLKVTDELFDEIATKVLSEDDLTVEVHHNGAASNHGAPSTPAVQTPKATARILIPAKAKETDADDVSEKSTSITPGDVLGLGNYASDGDEDDAIQSSGMPSSKVSNVSQQPTTKKSLEDIRVVENGNSQAKTEDHSKTRIDVESNPRKVSPNGHGDLGSKYSSKTKSVAEEDEINLDGERVLDGLDDSKSKISLGEKVVMRTELAVESFNVKRLMSDESQSKETRNKPDKHDKHEIKKSSAGNDSAKEVESAKDRTQDERHVRKERTDDRHGSKEKTKELKSGERAKDSDSRKRFTHSDDKEDRKKSERDRRGSVKEDHDRKKERTKDEKGERSRHKHAGDSSRNKRRRSSSVGSRDRTGKDSSAVGHASVSSDGSSDASKRKVHSKGRNLSPSPVRSRRRQVSRSPHSKHSQRRHSPYSSLDTTRRRSRSRSPVRRKR